ncbi:type II toxin-antitoxin system prevent-host-death family antitoxin [Sphingomonas sp. CL5.1]|uniref:type II toxin-antitoxin system Phd/YefM family antitoxin n=1 Tax=Sphingomonas sp. CL5.1 TaxID=2653203 RepID=UPI001581A366|nr:type II toxin-antitoxin system Phd/YefM family antitoxin [Sphingomonas sp. CL5.1]QKS00642.1 type II toxin-antitoxin system prevent-host-death family antitoxin [Sphingomonas sp. CL5.1]
METVNIQYAETHLSRLIERAARGEAFIIAKAGKPMVKVSPIDAPAKGVRRFGSLAGQINIPADFDRLCAAEIEQMFEGEE